MLATVQPMAKLTHESADTRVFFDFIQAISRNSSATRELQNHPCRVSAAHESRVLSSLYECILQASLRVLTRAVATDNASLVTSLNRWLWL